MLFSPRLKKFEPPAWSALAKKSELLTAKLSLSRASSFDGASSKALVARGDRPSLEASKLAEVAADAGWIRAFVSCMQSGGSSR